MLILENVNKKIKKRNILNDISYRFDEGYIYGVHGSNGCGKTMLLRAISGLLIPDKGVVSIDGKVLHKDISFPPSIGIIIENMELLPQYNSFDNLKILSKIKKVATDEDIHEAIKKVGLDPESKTKVKHFSLGMRQKLNIAQATFEKPDIILLDEPTNALDDESVLKIYELLREHKNRGAIIIITSHIKDDLNNLCDVTIKLNNGYLENLIY